MRQNNSKILKAAKEAGIDISKLTSERTDKNGKSYKAASPELNKLRKNLYGESMEESIKQDSEWEEVASKVVEDTDGFMTDYVWYTNGDKHVFVFGDSEIYRPEDGDYDWEIEVIDGKEAEAYREAQDWFNSYE